MRTYLYKLTSDRGGAPCAPPPRATDAPLLTLSICKPAIRRTAQTGDRIVGVTSHSLAATDGYPLESVIYAAIVSEGIEPRDYYAQRSKFRSRPDCIYAFHQANGTLKHTGRTRLHDDPSYEARDIGRYPFYRNARTLLCPDFRYFGSDAVAIPGRLTMLKQIVQSLGQGHRVFDQKSAEAKELDALFKMLWKLPSRFTPKVVEDEAYGHTPKGK